MPFTEVKGIGITIETKIGQRDSSKLTQTVFISIKSDGSICAQTEEYWCGDLTKEESRELAIRILRKQGINYI